MAAPTILDFYRYSVPRGLNVKLKGAWTTSSSTSSVVTAATGRVYFIQGIEFFVSCDADLGSESLDIVHSADTFGGVKNSTISIDSVEALITCWAPATEKTVASNYFGTVIFDVPVFLNAAETLTVSHSGGTGGISAGHIKFGFTGWWIDAGDL